MVWDAGTKQMKETLNAYGKIDLFRPYFDVQPKQVRNRLFQSLLPRKPSQMAVSNDLYGPFMLLLTMVALLLLSMKSSGYTLQDGTLIGTAMLTCFGAWILCSTALCTLCYVLSVDMASVHVFSLMGYALFGHCLVLLLTALFHPVHSHLFFFVLLVLFTLPSGLRVALFFASKTSDNGHKMTISIAVLLLHIGFLIYLHFGFHVFVEEIDEIFGESIVHSAVTFIAKGEGTVPPT